MRRLLLIGALVTGVAGSSACKRAEDTPLTAPGDAPAWEPRFAVAFDDGFTATPPRMGGRAPHDVLDQRLFAARIGHANLVLEVTVKEIWGRGRYEGRPDQYLDVRLGDTLLGELPPRVAQEQLIVVRERDELPATLEGQTLVMFLRWAPGETPSLHHHLMPRSPELIELIDAMVSHAEAEGIRLDDKSAKRRRRRREKARE